MPVVDLMSELPEGIMIFNFINISNSIICLNKLLYL